MVRPLMLSTALALSLAAGPVLAAGETSAQRSGTTQSTGVMQSRYANDMSRQEVRNIQQALDRAGYEPGPIDGIWGPRTRDAMRDFQQARGYDVTGEPSQRALTDLGVTMQRSAAMAGSNAQGRSQETQGATTQGGSMSNRAATGIVVYDLSPDQVRTVQQALNDAGHDVGPLDGVWGPRTQSAMRDYQRARGYQADGQPERESLSGLGVDTSGYAALQQHPTGLGTAGRPGGAGPTGAGTGAGAGSGSGS